LFSYFSYFVLIFGAGETLTLYDPESSSSERASPQVRTTPSFYLLNPFPTPFLIPHFIKLFSTHKPFFISHIGHFTTVLSRLGHSIKEYVTAIGLCGATARP
jgi:hypothetical protein